MVSTTASAGIRWPRVRTHRCDPAAAALQRGNRCAVVKFDAGIGGGGGQRIRQRPHAAAREVHSGNGVHVGDDRIHRQRALRRNAGVEGLEGEHAEQPLDR